MQWLRLYSSVLDTAKIMTLPLDAIGFWSLALLVASRANVRGTLPEPEDLAFITKQPIDRVEEFLGLLMARGLVVRDERGRLAIYKWHEYQPPSTERVQRHRASASHETDETKETKGTPRNGRNAGNPEERRVERAEEKAPPTPPEGGGAGEPFHAEDPEYRPAFHGEPAPEVRKVMDKTERLFDGCGWSNLARAACEEYPPAWVSEALDCAASNKADRWKFITGVLQRFKRQGGPDSAKQKTPVRKPEPIREENKPPVVSDEFRERHRRQEAALRAAGKGAGG